MAPGLRLSEEHPYTWSDIKVSEGEDPHAYGVKVEIWKHNGELTGFLSEYMGPVADPPVGKLEKIVFDEGTGQISFETKLSTGVTLDSTGTPVRVRDLYLFNGTIEGDSLRGTLRRTRVAQDAAVPAPPASEEIVVLRAEPNDEPRPFEEWLAGWSQILQIRGPGW
jgi:hypothetical protein